MTDAALRAIAIAFGVTNPPTILADARAGNPGRVNAWREARSRAGLAATGAAGRRAAIQAGVAGAESWGDARGASYFGHRTGGVGRARGMASLFRLGVPGHIERDAGKGADDQRRNIHGLIFSHLE